MGCIVGRARRIWSAIKRNEGGVSAGVTIQNRDRERTGSTLEEPLRATLRSNSNIFWTQLHADASQIQSQMQQGPPRQAADSVLGSLRSDERSGTIIASRSVILNGAATRIFSLRGSLTSIQPETLTRFIFQRSFCPINSTGRSHSFVYCIRIPIRLATSF